MKNRAILFLTILTVLFCFFPVRADDKLTAEELITKHLDSIGAKEKRDLVKNRLIVGISNFAILHTPSAATGKAVLASENQKTILGINFGSTNYPMEKFIFDGTKASIAFVLPGVRSALGNFLYNNRVLIEDGLFGGVLQSAWPLQDLKARKAKAEMAGTKKIDGREMYVLDYYPKGSNLTIKLFFDTQTFQHLRTEYRQHIAAPQGSSTNRDPNKAQEEAINNSARQQDTRNNLIEEFGDYRNEGGLMLPHSYRVYLLLNGGGKETNEFEWKFELSQFLFNQNFDPKSFDTQSE
jgi:hypothetical protein